MTREIDEARAARIDAMFAETAALHDATRRAGFGTLLAAADALWTAFAAGRKALIFGNGGSAADAQHFAAELVGRFERDRRGLAAIALTTDTSIVTAVANDHGFERVFARQIEALGAPGDVALAISTSGASANVVAAVEAARAGGLVTIAMTGRDGGRLGRLADVHVHVAHPSTARVQEVHRTQMHAICALIEERL